MDAILELIKTLIPFGIAFLFLWGIGRICCTNTAKQQPDKGTKQKKSKKKKSKSNEEQTVNDSDDSKINFSADKESRKRKRKRESDHHDDGADQILGLSAAKQRRLTSLQKAFLLKEVIDAPKALKPYRRKYPR
jgi:uncharacterized phage infection (PIP) family protein YhgE